LVSLNYGGVIKRAAYYDAVEQARINKHFACERTIMFCHVILNVITFMSRLYATLLYL